MKKWYMDPVEFYLVAAKNETMKISKKLHLTLNKEDSFLQQKQGLLHLLKIQDKVTVECLA